MNVNRVPRHIAFNQGQGGCNSAYHYELAADGEEEDSKSNKEVEYDSDDRLDKMNEQEIDKLTPVNLFEMLTPCNT